MQLSFRLKKRYKLLLFVLFYINFCNSQEKEIFGKAYYTKNHSFKQDENTQKTEARKMFFEFANSATFVLEFSKNQSSFEVQKGMVIDGEAYIRAATIFGGGKGIYFSDLEIDISLRQVQSIGDLFLIQSQISDLNWKLINETKTIDDFVCYKAQLVQNIKTSDDEVKAIIVEAWYSPEIPVSFGPVGYCGLPGLILELRNEKATYTLSKLEYKTKSDVNIKKPTKGKLVSNSAYELLVEKAVKERKEQSKEIKNNK